MKWTFALFIPSIAIIVAFHRLSLTITETATRGVSTTDLQLLTASTNAMAAGVLMTSVGFLLMVFLFNAMVLLASPR